MQQCTPSTPHTHSNNSVVTYSRYILHPHRDEKMIYIIYLHHIILTCNPCIAEESLEASLDEVARSQHKTDCIASGNEYKLNDTAECTLNNFQEMFSLFVGLK